MITLLILLALLFATPAVGFGAYRWLLPLLGASKPLMRKGETANRSEDFSVALVTVCHKMTPMLAVKLKQFHALQRDLAGSKTPVNAIYAGLDGLTAPTVEQLAAAGIEIESVSVNWVASPVRKGKNAILRDIVQQAESDVLLFSDVDADVDSASCQALLAHLHDPDIGAVTGRRQIHDSNDFAKGQQSYIATDDRIRAAEMKHLGSVTSSDGKLYAIKRALIDELPADVTDDLYTALGAIASGHRLVSEPAAHAIIGRPAKDIGHELVRRRRVTTRGLTTLWRRRSLMNPNNTGGYGVALFINKGLRRLAGPGLLTSAVCLGLAMVFVLLEQNMSAFFGLLALAVVAVALIIKSAALRYLVLGLLGMTLGVVDFLVGKRIVSWEPRKQLAERNIRDAP